MKNTFFGIFRDFEINVRNTEIKVRHCYCCFLGSCLKHDLKHIVKRPLQQRDRDSSHVDFDILCMTLQTTMQVPCCMYEIMVT